MERSCRILNWLLPLAALLLLPSLLTAQEAPAVTDVAAVVAAVEEAAPVAAPVVVAPTAWNQSVDTGSTAWLLVSAALVLLMVPGLALFYGGMARAKNVLNTFLLVMVCCGVIGLHWVIIGYAMVFPVITEDTALISIGENTYGEGESATKAIVSILGFDSNLVGFRSFSSPDPTSPQYFGRPITSGDTVGAVSTGVPELAFAMFQGMFAILTPALIIGSVVERVRFGPLLIFLLIWSTIVYAPVAHMVWNVNGYFFQKGVLDFAGGTVVHVLAGVSALALTLVIGPRIGFGKQGFRPHSLGLTLIGAGLLWFGWFGFNAGSAIAIGGSEHPIAGGVAVLAFTNTQIAAAAAATAWMLIEWIFTGKPTILGFASGMVAGLVVITPCAGHVLPWHSIIIGVIGGVVCFGGCRIKNIIKVDDSLDAFGVHGVGGALGALLVGVFAIRPVLGGSEQFFKQLTAVAICAVFAFVVSYVVALVIAKTIGFRVKESEEVDGLDIAVHGEEGYTFSDTFAPTSESSSSGKPSMAHA